MGHWSIESPDLEMWLRGWVERQAQQPEAQRSRVKLGAPSREEEGHTYGNGYGSATLWLSKWERLGWPQ